MHASENIQATIARLAEAGDASGYTVDTFGQSEGCPLLGLTRAASEPDTSERHIYLSAGIHGDEPAGPQALLELLNEDALPDQHSYAICPLLNPIGLGQGTRENGAGIDLNRDYRHLVSREISTHAAWIEQNVSAITIAMHLHEDWESRGFYLYELNFTQQPGFSPQIIQAVQAHLPIDLDEIIDGRIAHQGIIRPDRLPDLEEGDPEAIYLQKRYGGLNYTVETPSSQDFNARVKALKAAVLAIT
ncbi:succinylglutamate desuccinylase [Coraliomargarita sinensis]|uniref:Succinylglutamate desuccinylase n=1 Tax=Coraliomargarita sinensis TaxID=2174842 RepID=A0A317ZI49_9BACT|nr:M14 family metallocarboxypeptidase [Coraliomargarita sinensis]PXA03449.1 succinylglutamate desuccinylase [Coraliomargarita sinensis]